MAVLIGVVVFVVTVAVSDFEHFNPLCQPLLAGRDAAGAVEQSAKLPKVLPKLPYF